MPKFKLTATHGSQFNDSHITSEFSADTLEYVLENIELFLKGVGYHIDGVIDVIPFEKEEVSDHELLENAVDEWTRVLREDAEAENIPQQRDLFEHSAHYYDTDRNKPLGA
jgi:hypothetical protein